MSSSLTKCYAYWFLAAYLMFLCFCIYLQQLAVTEMDYTSAGNLLQKGLEYCLIQGIAYNQILFLLSKIMVLKLPLLLLLSINNLTVNGSI